MKPVELVAGDDALIESMAVLQWLAASPDGWRTVAHRCAARDCLRFGLVPAGLALRQGNRYRLTPWGRQRHAQIVAAIIDQLAPQVLALVERETGEGDTHGPQT